MSNFIVVCPVKVLIQIFILIWQAFGKDIPGSGANNLSVLKLIRFRGQPQEECKGPSGRGH